MYSDSHAQGYEVPSRNLDVLTKFYGGVQQYLKIYMLGAKSLIQPLLYLYCDGFHIMYHLHLFLKEGFHGSLTNVSMD